MFKSILFAILIYTCLNLFDIFLLFANFARAIDFRNYFVVLLLLNLVNSSNINLFKEDLEDTIDKLSLFSKAKIFDI